jgi:Uma2 family endonuclease
MKVMVSPNVAFYPDVVVVCGNPLITFEEALQNPVLVAEVLSMSTASFDRGEKFRQYRTIPYLRHIVFLEQDRPIIEHYERNEAGEWLIRSEYNSLEQHFELTINATPISLPLARIYRDVTFPDGK